MLRFNLLYIMLTQYKFNEMEDALQLGETFIFLDVLRICIKDKETKHQRA